MPKVKVSCSTPNSYKLFSEQPLSKESFLITPAYFDLSRPDTYWYAKPSTTYYARAAIFKDNNIFTENIDDIEISNETSITMEENYPYKTKLPSVTATLDFDSVDGLEDKDDYMIDIRDEDIQAYFNNYAKDTVSIEVPAVESLPINVKIAIYKNDANTSIYEYSITSYHNFNLGIGIPLTRDQIVDYFGDDLIPYTDPKLEDYGITGVYKFILKVKAIPFGDTTDFALESDEVEVNQLIWL